MFGNAALGNSVEGGACELFLLEAVDVPRPRPQPLPRWLATVGDGTIISESGGGTDPPRNLLLVLRSISLKFSVFVFFCLFGAILFSAVYTMYVSVVLTDPHASVGF